MCLRHTDSRSHVLGTQLASRRLDVGWCELIEIKLYEFQDLWETDYPVTILPQHDRNKGLAEKSRKLVENTAKDKPGFRRSELSFQEEIHFWQVKNMRKIQGQERAHARIRRAATDYTKGR